MRVILDYLRDNLSHNILQEIADKLCTLHHHLKSDGRGLSGGCLTEQIVFEILGAALRDFCQFHENQSDCQIQGVRFSFKKITGKSQLALNWSKNEQRSTTRPQFHHPVLLLNLKEGRWWRNRAGFDRHIPMGFFLIDHAYCNAHVHLRTNNKTDSLIDAENLYKMIVNAMENQMVLELPAASTGRYSYSFNSGFHDLPPAQTWPSLPLEKRRPRFIDLFCGVGGFHIALEKVGGRCVFASDIDRACRENYLQNWGIDPAPDIRSVRETDIPPFDILCAGFPCQPFSKAGDQAGFINKSKGNLFFEIVRIIKHHAPYAFILENVKNIVSHDHGNTWKTIHRSLEDLGYRVHDTPVILSPLQYGIPQSRERAFILGRRQSDPLPAFPVPRSVGKTSITSILMREEGGGGGVAADEGRLKGKHHEAALIWEEFCQILVRNKIVMPHFPLWTDEWGRDRARDDAFYVKYKNWIDKNRTFYHDHVGVLEPWLSRSRSNPSWTGALRKLEWQCAETSLRDCLWTFRGSGLRVRNLDYAPTLVAMSMIPIFGPEWRKLSPREVCRLQGFPDSYQYHPTECYKQMGNAVNVVIVEHAVRWLLHDWLLV